MPLTARLLRVFDALDRLLHDAVVDGDHQDNDVCDAGAARSHRRESGMAGRVEERDSLARPQRDYNNNNFTLTCQLHNPLNCYNLQWRASLERHIYTFFGSNDLLALTVCSKLYIIINLTSGKASLR